MKKSYDIAAWGVTGGTGQIFANAYARYFGASTASSPLKLALVGRNAQKLEAVAREATITAANGCTDEKLREEAGQFAKNDSWAFTIIALPHFKGTPAELNADMELLLPVCNSTKVLVSLAGPYCLCGEAAIAAAAHSGCDYVDITGELHWVEKMRVKYDAIAKQNNRRIMPCCGYDYVLNDLGLRHAFELSKTGMLPGPVVEVHQVVSQGTTVMSGGTMRSIVAAMESQPLSKLLGSELRGPYTAVKDKPSAAVVKKNESIGVLPRYSNLMKCWMGMGLFTGYAAAYLHWVNATNGWTYGKELVLWSGEGGRGWLGASVMGAAYSMAMMGLLVVSRLPFLKWFFPAAGNIRGRQWRTKNDKFVQLATAVKNADDESGTYTLRFVSGEPYEMTGTTSLLCAAAACERASHSGPFGVNSPATLVYNELLRQIELSRDFTQSIVGVA